MVGCLFCDNLPACFPSSCVQARYHLFNFKHSHEGDNLESPVFVYSCPGYNCSVKVRHRNCCSPPPSFFFQCAVCLSQLPCLFCLTPFLRPCCPCCPCLPLAVIQERMMYSTCKGPLLDALESEHGIEFAKKVRARCSSF